MELEFTRLSAAEQLERALAFEQAMRTRRSVRAFSDEPVAWEVIETAVRTAARAPSGANKQPWRFVAIESPELKRRIREGAEAEERENYQRRFPESWLQDLEPFETNWEKPYLEQAPWLIAVFALDYNLTADGEKTKNYYVGESVGIAAGFLLAALHHAGLATLTHTPSPMGFLREILERPRNERPYLLIPVGFPAEGATVPDIRRKEMDEVLLRR